MRDELEEFAVGLGADLYGVADLEHMRGIDTIPTDLLDDFETAVCMGVRISDRAVETIEDEPTTLYVHQYEAANKLLDEISLRVQNKLQEEGYNAMAIAVSQKLDDWRSHISHKALARAAGLGWLGKSLLLVSPEYGPRIRLTSVLTDADLEPDEPMDNQCGECTSCMDACPADAIKNTRWTNYPETRDDALYFDRCRSLLVDDFMKREEIGYPVCGVCVKTCPHGQ